MTNFNKLLSFKEHTLFAMTDFVIEGLIDGLIDCLYHFFSTVCHWKA